MCLLWEQLKCFDISPPSPLPSGLIILIIFLFSDVDKYDLDMLQKTVKTDYRMALEMTSDILLLELIYRIVVCAFEVCILHPEYFKY